MTRYTKYKKSHNSADITSSLNKSSSFKARAEYNPLWGRNSNKHIHKVCLRCRKRGHALENCKESMDESVNTDKKTENETNMIVCYRCGSIEHSLSKCPKPALQNNALPFAKCFICGGIGHLVRDCEKNDNGLYPKGGSCHHCGSKRHFARDCEERKKLVANREQQSRDKADVSYALEVKGEEPLGDEDDLLADLRQKSTRKKKGSSDKVIGKKPKVVQF